MQRNQSKKKIFKSFSFSSVCDQVSFKQLKKTGAALNDIITRENQTEANKVSAASASKTEIISTAAKNNCSHK